MRLTNAVTLGQTSAGRLNLELETGQGFVDALQLQDPKTGEPIEWPAGVRVWIRTKNKATARVQEWQAEVNGSWIRWNVPVESVHMVSRDAWGELWISYASAPPVLWAEGPVSWTRS